MNINESVRYVNYVLRNSKYYHEILRRRVILATVACFCLFMAGITAVGTFTTSLTVTQNLLWITPFIFSLGIFAITTYAFSKSTGKMRRIHIDHRVVDDMLGHRDDAQYVKDIQHNIKHMPPMLKKEIAALEAEDLTLHRALEDLRHAQVKEKIVRTAA